MGTWLNIAQYYIYIWLNNWLFFCSLIAVKQGDHIVTTRFDK